MKAEELMIGDWVNHTYRNYISGEIVSTNFRVAQIRKYTTEDASYHLYAERQNMGDVENISPIPLTPEILEKNGFKKVKNSFGGCYYSIADDYYDLTIEEYSDSNWYVEYNDTEVPLPTSRNSVCYVHELQHTLKLFGIKMDIVL